MQSMEEVMGKNWDKDTFHSVCVNGRRIRHQHNCPGDTKCGTERSSGENVCASPFKKCFPFQE